MELQFLSRALFDRCGFWRRLSFQFQMAIYLLGLVACFIPGLEATAGISTFFLMLTIEVCLWRHESTRREAESLRRRLDLLDGLGWQMSQQEHADMGAKYGEVSLAKPAEKYFASTQPPSPMRAIENVIEASWWSERIARSCAHITFSVFLAALLGSIALLVLSLRNVISFMTLDHTAAVVEDTLLAVSSVGLWRFAVGFNSFAHQSRELHYEARMAKQAGSVTESDAIRISYDYFVARGEAPMLYRWRYTGISVGRLKISSGMKDRLNKAWADAYAPNDRH